MTSRTDEATKCRICGSRIYNDGEARVLIPLNREELISVAVGADLLSTRERALVGLDLLDSNAARVTRDLLRDAGLLPTASESG